MTIMTHQTDSQARTIAVLAQTLGALEALLSGVCEDVEPRVVLAITAEALSHDGVVDSGRVEDRLPVDKRGRCVVRRDLFGSTFNALTAAGVLQPEGRLRHEHRPRDGRRRSVRSWRWIPEGQR